MSLAINSKTAIISFLTVPVVYIGLKIAHRNGLINLGFGAPVSSGQLVALIPKKHLIGGVLIAAGIIGIVWIIKSVRAENARLESLRQDELKPEYRLSMLLCSFVPKDILEGDVRKMLTDHVSRSPQTGSFDQVCRDEKVNNSWRDTDFNNMIVDVLFYYVYNREIPFQAVFRPDYFSINTKEVTIFNQDSRSTIMQAASDVMLRNEYADLIRSIIQNAYQIADGILPETTWFNVEFKIAVDGVEQVTRVSSLLVSPTEQR